MSTDKAPSQEPNFIPVDGLSYVMPMPSPDAAAQIAELQEQIAKLEAERDEWKDSAINGGNAGYLREQIAKLEAKLAAAEKDAARWKWFVANWGEPHVETALDAAMKLSAGDTAGEGE